MRKTFSNILTKEFLIQEYWNNKKDMYVIAKEINCCPETIFYRMKKLKIPTRNRSQAQKGKKKSLECVAKMRAFMLSDKNPFRGKKHSKEWNEKIGKRNAISHLGLKRSPEALLKQSETIKKLWQTSDFRNKILPHLEKGRNNPKRIANMRRGTEHHMYGKISNHGKGDYYKGIWMRSQWEIAYAKYLDSKSIKWQYESKAFELIIDGKETTYTPDFYLNNFNKYIEVKGYWRDDARIKYENFLKTYPLILIEVIDKKTLSNLGIKIRYKRK